MDIICKGWVSVWHNGWLHEELMQFFHVFCNICKYSVPPLVQGQVWHELDSDRDNAIEGSYVNGPLKLLKIDKEIETIDEPYHQRAGFWKSLNIYPERNYYS